MSVCPCLTTSDHMSEPQAVRHLFIKTSAHQLLSEPVLSDCTEPNKLR